MIRPVNLWQKGEHSEFAVMRWIQVPLPHRYFGCAP